MLGPGIGRARWCMVSQTTARDTNDSNTSNTPPLASLVLLPGNVGMRVSMIVRTTAMHDNDYARLNIRSAVANQPFIWTADLLPFDASSEALGEGDLALVARAGRVRMT